MSKNSIEFSLSNSEQRDSWLNSGHQTLDADTESMISQAFQACYSVEGYPSNRCILSLDQVGYRV